MSNVLVRFTGTRTGILEYEVSGKLTLYRFGQNGRHHQNLIPQEDFILMRTIPVYRKELIEVPYYLAREPIALWDLIVVCSHLSNKDKLALIEDGFVTVGEALADRERSQPLVGAELLDSLKLYLCENWK